MLSTLGEMAPDRVTPARPIDLLIQASCGPDPSERASLPFVVGTVAARAGARVVVFLVLDAVRLVARSELSTQPLIVAFQEHGGEIWAWESSLHARAMTTRELVDGVAAVTIVSVTAAVLAGTRTVTL